MQRGGRATEIGLQIAGGLVLAGAGLVLLPVPWRGIGHILAGRWYLALAAVAGSACAGSGLWLAGRRRRRLRRWPLRALPWWFAVLSAAAVVAAGVIALTLLLGEANQAKDPDQRAQLRIDAIRTGLSVAAGTAGAAALLLAMRRQWAAERSQAHEEFDASERRITELYTKAVEQLGSDKAPVRLGGLYALERLAQGAPDHRQTVIDVICAYLRMPYTPPPATPDPPRPATMRQLRQARTQSTRPAAALPPDPREEHQVRQTAQRILQRHLTVAPDITPAVAARLRPDPDQIFWAGICIDLTNATLTDFDLSHARLAAVDFTQATFTGEARFRGTIFVGTAGFGGATFAGEAEFAETTFASEAEFAETTFASEAEFRTAMFACEAKFAGATFIGTAGFGRAGFAGETTFAETTFAGGAVFAEAIFHSIVWFEGATFAGLVLLDRVSFIGNPGFDDADFSQATVVERASCEDSP